MDATDGAALSGVFVSFECESIPYPKEPLVGWSTNGTIDIEYLLAFGRKQHRGLRGYKTPGDRCHIVLTRNGYAPAVFEFKLDELEGECAYPIALGQVLLKRE